MRNAAIELDLFARVLNAFVPPAPFQLSSAIPQNLHRPFLRPGFSCSAPFAST